MDWLNEVDRFFEYMEISEEKKVSLVTYRLKGDASSWWERLQITKKREERGPMRTSYGMKHLPQARFLPPEYEQYLFQ